MIRGFLKFAIERPALNHIFMLFMAIMSIFAYKNIPKEIFPPSQLDQITIRGGYVGASADILDKMAVKEIEDKLLTLSQIDTVYSTIQNGSFIIRAELKSGNSPESVLNDVKDIISNIKRDLPSDMDEPTAKVFIQDYPLVMIAVSADMEKAKLLDIADKLKSRLSQIKELSTIDIRGDSNEEILIKLNQKKIEAYGLSKSSIYKAISNLSTIFPIGTVKQRGEHLYISTINGEKSRKKLERTILSIDGKRVYLRDIADVKIGLATPEQISHFNGKPNVSLDIKKTKEGNALSFVKEIKRDFKGSFKSKLFPDC